MSKDDSNLFEGKKRKKIKPIKLKIGRRVIRYSKIDQWLKSVQELIKDIEELSRARKKAQEKMKTIKKQSSTQSKEEKKSNSEKKEKS